MTRTSTISTHRKPRRLGLPISLASALVASLLLPMASPALADRSRIGIVASVGSSTTVATARAMLRRGTSWFRVNLAHRNRPQTIADAQRLRRAARAVGRSVPLLLDLPGGKIRTGFAPRAGQAALREGQPFILRFGVRSAASTDHSATIDYPDFGRYARVGDRVLLHQGKLELEITSVAPNEVATRVIRGGNLRGHATVDLVGREPLFPPMTRLDRRMLRAAVDAGATHIGVSMVQSVRQIHAVRRTLARLGASHIRIVAKIETRSAMQDLEGIIGASDAVMIAGGDLATAMGSRAALNAAEDAIAATAVRLGRPLIWATAFEGPDAERNVRRARRNGTRYVVLKNTAIIENPEALVGRTRALLRRVQ